MSSRDKILHVLRTARRYEPDTPRGEDIEVVPVEGDVVERFVAEAERNLARVVRCATWGEAWTKLSQELREREFKTALCWGANLFGDAGLMAALSQAGVSPIGAQGRADAQVGITAADAGIAATGSLVLRSRSGALRCASLLPPVHYAFLERDAIVRSIEVWLAQNRHTLADGANTMFISGPSRSGDIEMILTLGVHGPGEVTIFLI